MQELQQVKSQTKSIEEVLAELRAKHEKYNETVPVEKSEPEIPAFKNSNVSYNFLKTIMIQAVTAAVMVALIASARVFNPEIYSIIETFLKEHVF